MSSARCPRCSNTARLISLRYRVKGVYRAKCCRVCFDFIMASRAQTTSWRKRNRAVVKRWHAERKILRAEQRVLRKQHAPIEVCPLYKPCKKCPETKHRRDLFILKSNRDGRSNVCSDCHYKRNQEWKRTHPTRTRILRRFNENNRRAAMAKATPAWTDMEAIRKIYERCPPGMEVDHIIPILGKTVRGLHVPWNLQYLSGSANRKKRTRLLESYL